ncbi:hypothetical protein M8J77_010603 [Diaphorina citri]|nr:hypothetical protein M8J77_010603 [Diaphorina citri]
MKTTTQPYDVDKQTTRNQKLREEEEEEDDDDEEEGGRGEEEEEEEGVVGERGEEEKGGRGEEEEGEVEEEKLVTKFDPHNPHYKQTNKQPYHIMSS